MTTAYATCTGFPKTTPGEAIDDLRRRLTDPKWNGWNIDGTVKVLEMGNEFMAEVGLHLTLTDPLKLCIHNLDPDACTICIPF